MCDYASLVLYCCVPCVRDEISACARVLLYAHAHSRPCLTVPKEEKKYGFNVLTGVPNSTVLRRKKKKKKKLGPYWRF